MTKIQLNACAIIPIEVIKLYLLQTNPLFLIFRYCHYCLILEFETLLSNLLNVGHKANIIIFYFYFFQKVLIKGTSFVLFINFVATACTGKVVYGTIVCQSALFAHSFLLSIVECQLHNIVSRYLTIREKQSK